MAKKIIKKFLTFCFYSFVLFGSLFVFLYFNYPKQSIVNLPGKVFEATEIIEHLDDTSLHGVSTQSVTIDSRNDFVKHMWENRRIYFEYTYRPYESIEQLTEMKVDTFNHAIEAEYEAVDSLECYTLKHYAKDEAEAEEVLAPLTWYDDYVGDSATLLIMVSLIGMYEGKAWFNSDTKVVMTGSMDANGNVLPVGGVRLKKTASKIAKGDVLIVPKEQLDETKRFTNYFWRPLTIVGVETIDETIQWLDENIQ